MFNQTIVYSTFPICTKELKTKKNLNVTLNIPLSISSLPLKTEVKNNGSRYLQHSIDFLDQYIRGKLEEKIREDTEYSDSDAFDEEPLPSPFGGKTHSGSSH